MVLGLSGWFQKSVWWATLRCDIVGPKKIAERLTMLCALGNLGMVRRKLLCV